MGNLTFKGGIHSLPKLHHGKGQTKGLAIEALPAPAEVSIPVSQHAGAPAKPIVKVGDTVTVGQMIAEAGGFVSAPVHASVSGKVTKLIAKPNNLGKDVLNIVIENDFENTLCEDVKPRGDLDQLTPDEIKKIIADAGCVGMGGAGFPTHVKLSPPPEKTIDAVIINGAECEPFLTADHRLMLEQPETIIFGLKAVMKVLGVKSGYIAVEDNKPDAIEALNKALDTPEITVKVMQTKYPQGSEKQLIDTITGRQIPSGKLPMDVGVVVVNVSSARAIANAIKLGRPNIDRVVTVTGSINKPANLLVPIGTKIQDVVDYCGGFKENTARIVSGGPMMGQVMVDTEGPVTKTTSGILGLDENLVAHGKLYSCMRCGKCASVCPIHLQPYFISAAVEKNLFETAEKYHAMDCMSCGCCSYVCPANRPLAHLIRVGKDQIAAARRKQQQKQ